MSDKGKRFRKLKTEDLRLGMYVHDVGRSWLTHPWLKRSRIITSRREIHQLVNYGIREVLVDTSRGVMPIEAPPAELQTPRPQPEKVEDIERRTGVRKDIFEDEVPQEVEISNVRNIYFHALGGVRAFQATVRSDDTVNMVMIEQIVEDMIDSVYRNRDAFLSLLKLKEYDHYDFSHPMNVAVMAVSFGRFLGLSRDKLRSLGMGTLLMDVGKTRIPPEILYKPGVLSPRELEAARKHAMLGARVLHGVKGLPREALMIALHHHERFDGTGYPYNLAGAQLNPFIIISGIVDVFDAISANRVYRKAVRPFEALRKLFMMRRTKFPSNWLDRFIQCVGIYPTGTVIKLNTGEIAVVVEVNHAQLLRPKIKLLTDRQGRPLARFRAIDLNTEVYLEREVKEVLDPRTVGIDPSRYVDPYHPLF